MEFHQLRYALAVARTGSFSRGAEACHVSQPSLSQQIRKLEEELGERLFERDRKGVRPTPTGERFLARAARVLDELADAHREAEETRSLARGRIILGVLPTIAPYFLPPIVANFLRKHPGIQIVIHEETTTALANLLIAHEIDLAIASLPIRGENFEITPLFSEELLLAVPPTHPLAKRRSIRLADLESEPFVLMKEGHCLGDQVLRFCQHGGVEPHVVSRSAQVETVRRLVHAGLGLSLVPKMASEKSLPGQPIFRSLAGTPPTRTIAAFWHRRRPLSLAASEFLRQLQAARPQSARKSRR